MSADHRDEHLEADGLADEVELPLELKEDILRVQAQLAQVDHWQLLGIPWNAPEAAVRAAYLEKVKRYHPDRYSGRKLGPYLGHIERIFRALTEARDVLTDERRRRDYVRQSAPPEERARHEMRRLQDEERARERRARLSRGNALVARASRVQEIFKRGQQAMEAEDWSKAVNDFLTVVGLDPRHEAARALAEQAKRRLGIESARTCYERGLVIEVTGDRAAALQLFRQAAESDPANPNYAVEAARLALDAGEVEAAVTLASQAARAAPGDARAHEVLGQARRAQGNTREARRELARAIELDPSLETAKALLKKMRWSLF